MCGDLFNKFLKSNHLTAFKSCRQNGETYEKDLLNTIFVKTY